MQVRGESTLAQCPVACYGHFLKYKTTEIHLGIHLFRMLALL